MIMALSILLLMAFVASAQTRPHPSQVKPSQVRIGIEDKRPGTLVNSATIQDGRHVVPMKSLRRFRADFSAEPPVYWEDEFWPGADPEAKAICVTVPMRADSANTWGDGYWGEACYTEAGQRLLLQDPAWAAWYATQ